MGVIEFVKVAHLKSLILDVLQYFCFDPFLSPGERRTDEIEMHGILSESFKIFMKNYFLFTTQKI